MTKNTSHINKQPDPAYVISIHKASLLMTFQKIAFNVYGNNVSCVSKAYLVDKMTRYSDVWLSSYSAANTFSLASKVGLVSYLGRMKFGSRTEPAYAMDSHFDFSALPISEYYEKRRKYFLNLISENDGVNGVFITDHFLENTDFFADFAGRSYVSRAIYALLHDFKQSGYITSTKFSHNHSIYHRTDKPYQPQYPHILPLLESPVPHYQTINYQELNESQLIASMFLPSANSVAGLGGEL